MKRKRVPLMSHVDRQRLIRIPFVGTRMACKSWGGVNVGHAGTVPDEGHRTWHLSPDDESWLRYGKGEDDE